MRIFLSIMLWFILCLPIGLASDEEFKEFKVVTWKPLLLHHLEQEKSSAFRFNFPLKNYNVAELNKYENIELSYFGNQVCLKEDELDNLLNLNNLIELCLDYCPYEEAVLEKLFSSLKNLVSLDLQGMKLTITMLDNIAVNNPKLQYLSLRHCVYEAESLSQLLQSVECIECLDIFQCPFNEIDAIALLGNNPLLHVRKSQGCQSLLLEKGEE